MSVRVPVKIGVEAQNRKCSVRVIIKEEFIIPGIKEVLRSAVENVVRNAIKA
jgi:hypothetical protein